MRDRLSEVLPPSRRSRLAVTVTARTLRPIASRLPTTPAGVQLSRRIVATSLAAFGPTLGGTQVAAVSENGGAVRGEWVRGPGVTRWDAAVLYLHGSGYALCSPETHRGLISRLSVRTGLPVFAVDYRLAPEHPFPAAADDVRAGWEWLTTHHFAADRIVLAGDSAGGHLALDLCLSLQRDGRTLPAAQALLSPLLDLTCTLAARRDALRPDPIISAAAAAELVALYTRGVDPADPRLTLHPTHGQQLPPTLIHAGGAEMFTADAHHLHRILRAAGTDSHLRVWPGLPHVFQALPRLFPEAEPATRQLATFLAGHVPAATSRPTTARRSA